MACLGLCGFFIGIVGVSGSLNIPKYSAFLASRAFGFLFDLKKGDPDVFWSRPISTLTRTISKEEITP